MSNPSFFAELKRRNVYKVAVAYAVVAWLLIQAASIILPTYDAPPWVMKVLVAIIALGFPIALVMGWAFEVTPEGIRRTDDLSAGPQRPSSYRAWVVVVLAAGMVSIALFFLGRLPGARQRDASFPIAKSIAVLPLENLSDEKENVFFADGVQSELLTNLAKIKQLKVISRTSVMQYKSGTARNLRQIAQELGVSNVVEGSVRRFGNRVRVSVQLIDAFTDRQIWAENYDRTLADSISLQGELATEIANALRATLTPEEKARVESKPTENAEAYLLFLRAREFQERLSILLEDVQMAEQLYKQAIALDPNFALAHARLSHAIANIYHEFQPTKARETEARKEAREALRLQPALAEGHVALGLCYLWIDADYERALAEFELASRTMPSNAEIPGCMGAVRRRQGRWAEALAKFEEAVAIDPRNEHTVANLGDTYAHVRDWAACARTWDRAQTISPALIYKVIRGYVAVWWKGDTGLLKRVLAEVPAGVDPNGLATFTRWDVALLERDFAAAERALTTSQIELIPAVYSGGGPPLPKSYLRGCIELARGDAARAQPFFEAARAHFQTEVNASPEDAFRHAYLGLLYAHMGKREDAIREGRRARELKPESTDALSGTWMTAFLALIYTRVGETDLALPLIEHCLGRPGVYDNFEESITSGDLKLRWGWDPIRGDPRFQKLLATAEQNPPQH